MEVFKDALTNYMIQNWALILVLIAFSITLKVTVFLEWKRVRSMYFLIIFIFLLSISVFIEFYLSDLGGYIQTRTILMAVRYSATPFIVGFIIYALVKKARLYVLIPAGVVAILNIVSIFTGIVFSLNESGELVRGVLGYIPYIAVGIYCFFLVFILIRQSNKQITEIIPIAFLAFAFVSGIIFPFLVGKEYSKIFCNTIAISLFVYYVFLILQLTKKDALTGLLNRQAYYAAVKNYREDINGFISIDMNGLKSINDSKGHLAGDEALKTLASRFALFSSLKTLVYRIGGDEFVIICRKMTEEELIYLVDRIKDNVKTTNYSCSIGYCYAASGSKEMEDMVKESDEMMYEDKANYYKNSNDRRINKSSHKKVNLDE